jgi:Thioesterase-like superfamily
MSTETLYESDGDAFVPTALSTGPWDQGAQHGGAPSALLTRCIEGVDALVPMSLVRTTFEILRPVPLAPLTVSTEVVRAGKRVQLVVASLHADGVEMVRATGLRIRDADLDVPDDLAADDPPPLGPEHGVVTEFMGEPVAKVAFHTHANDIRFVDGGFDRPGPATAWIRLTVPVVDDEPVSPRMRLAAASDFGNGLSWVLPRLEWMFVNPDLTVHSHREPDGEWIGLRSRTLPGQHGSATAESELFDHRGRMGRAVQSLYLDRR